MYGREFYKFRVKTNCLCNDNGDDKKIYVWPSAIEGGVDKGTPMEEKCLDEKILKKLGRNKSCQF